ncbi:hypothetical protein ACE1OE_01480 [Vibrio sp. E150_011]|uniref:hypothetical protein n=1 Tax=Vibrio sp. 10N.261.51.F12 TaxID=3229679 RepID=UPI00355025A7
MLKYVLPFCLLATTSVMANTNSQEENQTKIDNAMAALQTKTLRDVDFTYISVNEDSIIATYHDYLSLHFRESYITESTANKLDLTPGFTFNAYDFNSVDDLEKKIASRINKDKPKYFSVDFYQYALNQSERMGYTAKVTFY